MGGFTPYEKANTLCISVLQNHSPHPIERGRHDMQSCLAKIQSLNLYHSLFADTRC